MSFFVVRKSYTDKNGNKIEFYRQGTHSMEWNGFHEKAVGQDRGQTGAIIQLN